MQNMKMTPEKAKFLIDLFVAVSFVAVAAGKYFSQFVDLPEEEI